MNKGQDTEQVELVVGTAELTSENGFELWRSFVSWLGLCYPCGRGVGGNMLVCCLFRQFLILRAFDN